MRKPFVAGNWKMNKTAAQAGEFVSQVLPGLKAVDGVEIVLCPPFPALCIVSQNVDGSAIGVGAQNLFWEASGAYTGEISPAMVKEFCSYVIIGHSERRIYFGETDETVCKKVKAAQAIGLVPIVCIGETLAENEAGQTGEVLRRQIRGGLAGVQVSDPSKLVVAYEPVWAIGTGRAASAEGANAVVRDFIRPTLKEVLGADAAQAIRVLYGGSATAANAAEFFRCEEIDGALVGGASLKPEFIQICQAAK